MGCSRFRRAAIVHGATLSAPLLVILAGAALITSIISAIIGMGGGILLLAVMLCFLDHANTIPAHGAVQLVSNGTRLLAFRKHIHWPTLSRFVMGAVPGAIAGTLLIRWLRADHMATTEPFLKLGIGAYVLIITFLRKPPTTPGSDATARQPFALFGALSGLLGLTIGAVGPLIAPLFLSTGFAKERVIATKATCQACIHFVKIPALLATGLVNYSELSVVIVVMSLMVIPGTLLGRRLLQHVSETQFVVLYKVALLVAGLKVLLVDGVYAALRTIA
jgi:uncharacterized membrane protein YfcA